MPTLPVFNSAELQDAKMLLSAKVATMLGRKMEEGDWSFVYCNAKRIPEIGWSNLSIDISYNGLGVEHKMRCIRKNSAIQDVCGTTLMHPAATRSIRIPEGEPNPNKVSEHILTQYAELIAARTKKVSEGHSSGHTDMRIGWLLWKELLDEFLYFEEPMTPPKPSHFYANWNVTPERGARKATRSLWIYEKDTGIKRYSVTTTAGAKIQPYFDVPSPRDPNLYYFRVQGNVIDINVVEVWITRSTAKFLESHVGSLDFEILSQRILQYNPVQNKETSSYYAKATDLAIPVKISLEAYNHLKSKVASYISDEQVIQIFAQSMTST
ncbi:hypothetical protein CKO12_09710 [Chromatium okenii]|uniref:hypothetical protein n=1 Tax=Chromatium okenii TaxID=61644 RepID=UPI001903A185|nr:hypothetical protein [Chromatium okenii]MBK1642147.1 hypothetical protein [Chromatium okenii]